MNNNLNNQELNLSRGVSMEGEWVYGDLINTVGLPGRMKHCHTKTWIVQSAFGNGGWFNIRRRQYVKPKTVGKFIGVLDVNEKMIFTGDIVQIGNYQHIVEIHGGMRVYLRTIVEKSLREYDVYLSQLIDDVKIEVIGSIHDDMLTQKISKIK